MQIHFRPFALRRFGLSAVIAACGLMFLAAFPAETQARPASAIINEFGTKTNWPSDNDWKPMNSLNDPIDAGVPGEIDFIGDATNPGAYFFSDANYWYIRARVHTPTVVSATFHDTILVLIDNNADAKPEYSFSWDSKSNDITKHGLELQVQSVVGSTWATTQMDDRDGQSGQKVAPPDFAVPTDGTTGDGYIRTLDGQVTTNFGNTTFVDFAVSWGYLGRSYQGAPITNLTRTQTWAIQLGSIADSTDHNNITGDVAAGKNPTDAGLSWGSPSSPTAVTLSTLRASGDAKSQLAPWVLVTLGLTVVLGGGALGWKRRERSINKR